MRLPLTLSSPQERLVGERVVVKEIEIFGNFWYPKVGEDIGGANRMALREQILRQLLVHRPQHVFRLVAI
jgi:hypothetical protein